MDNVQQLVKTKTKSPIAIQERRSGVRKRHIYYFWNHVSRSGALDYKFSWHQTLRRTLHFYLQKTHSTDRTLASLLADSFSWHAQTVWSGTAGRSV